MKNNISKLMLLVLTVVTMCSCSLLQVEDNTPESPASSEKPKTLSEREAMFSQAENYFEQGQYDEAMKLYKVLTKEPPVGSDRIYESSLMDLADLYEKNDQSELAILAIDELIKRRSQVVERASFQVALIKNHYRVDNYFQAKKLRDELDELYRSHEITLKDLSNALYYHTELQFDRHILHELNFIGDMQKYFVFVLEGNDSEDASRLAELLKQYYEKFSQQLDKPLLSKSIKKQLAISLVDQLNRFERYKIPNTNESSNSLKSLTQYLDQQKELLTARLTNGNY